MKTQHTKIWDTPKALQKRKIRALSIHIRKEEKYLIQRIQEKKNIIIPKQAKERNNRDKVEISEIENKNNEKINETRGWFFERSNKTEKSPARLTKGKKERIQIIQYQEQDRRFHYRHHRHQMIIRNAMNNFTHKFDNLDEIYRSRKMQTSTTHSI